MNHLPYLKSLLKSIFVDNPPKNSFEMIYLDNCSTDNSIDYISNNYPEVKIIKNDKILGFGANNNKAIAKAQGKYVAIINPDIIILPNSLDYLYEYAEANTNQGIIVPLLLNPDMSIQYSVRGFISIKILLMRLLTHGKDTTNNKTIASYLCKNIDINKTQPINWAIGAAMFISKNHFDTLGGFDLDYFLYMEDEDICLRSWKRKKPVIFYPKAQMIHNHLRASSKIGKKMYLHIKSMITFFKKHGLFISNYIE